MCIDSEKTPILYSVGTNLAYNINEEFYNNVHFVWCTAEFNNIGKQPPTSDPKTICIRYLQQISTGDIHTNEIANNMAGILSGAKFKYQEGIINKQALDYISSIISWSKFKDYLPVIYLIHTSKIKDKLTEVKETDLACNKSVEYKIENLEQGEFSIIKFDDLLHDIINVFDGRVGDNSAKHKKK